MKLLIANKTTRPDLSSHLLLPTAVTVLLTVIGSEALTFGQEAARPQRKTPFRDLQHRWEYDPDLNPQWVEPPKEIGVRIDVGSLSVPDVQNRIAAMQLATIDANRAENRDEAFVAALDQLKKDLTLTNRQAIQAIVSAAGKLASSREEIEQVWLAVGDNSVAQTVLEPWLIKWKSPVALEAWRTRIETGSKNFGQLFNAIDGLNVVGTEADKDVLITLLNRTDTLLPIQIAVSKSLGSIAPQGLEDLAKQLLSSNRASKELLATNLVINHSSEESLALLETVVKGENKQAQACRVCETCRTPTGSRFAISSWTCQTSREQSSLGSCESLGSK